jgi:hypothetical protein
MITEEFTTQHYRVQSFDEDLAFIIADLNTGAEQLLTHSAAFLFGRDLDFLRLQGGILTSRCGPDRLDEVVRRYWNKPAA